MGVSLTQYRTRIGCFGGGTIHEKFMYSEEHAKFGFDSLGGWRFENKRKWVKNSQSPAVNSIKRKRLIVMNAIALSLLLHLAVLLSGDVHENPGPQDRSDISICHVNIRSLRGDLAKLDHISCGLGHKYDLITVSETWLNSSCKSSSLLLNGFQVPFRRDRPDDQGYGGVMVWASVNIAAKRRSD